MPVRTLLGGLLLGVLYPVWLVAGAFDYFCHRRSRIEHTSGLTESQLHVAQFVAVAVIFVPAVLLRTTFPILILMVAACLVHTALSFVDVSHTIGRRYISTLEQHVHGFLNVIPFVAIALLAILEWDTLSASGSVHWRPDGEPLSRRQQAGLLASFVVLAGAPIVEEWTRSRRAALSGAQR